ncbi:MAG: NAD(P)/FAD-dependent oxidoreductase [Alphaproteobacteria bacterium]|nr:NAD(P)/FAD-dependent oxidoreductase [Alphaproteobacteria bacterium]
MVDFAKHYDAVIIGGGHNGLVCAFYLAQKGKSVAVLERRHVVGGAAVTEEFYPGFRNSVASYTVSLLNPKIIKDMQLYNHGLRIVERQVPNFMPLGDSSYFLPSYSLEAMQKEVAKFSARDAEVLPQYYAALEVIAQQLRETLLDAPPNMGGGLKELVKAAKLALRTSKLTLDQKRDLLELFSSSAGDFLDKWFESAPVKALFGFDGIVGNYASPYAAGSAYVLLHHVFGEVNGKTGVWGHAIGGMGAITQAMAQAAQEQGAEIAVNAAVKRVTVAKNKVQTVVLEDGREIQAKTIISNIHPQLLFLNMLDDAVVPQNFKRRITHWKGGAGTCRMNVALSQLPQFTCKPSDCVEPFHTGGIIIAPSLEYMERAYLHARQYGWSQQPVVEMLIPSTLDDSLAPKGHHVASLFCQHVAPQLSHGRTWDECREEVADLMIDTVNQYAPNFKASVVGRQINSPLDLERNFGLVKGDIFHGALSLDQLFSARPMLGYADYRTPVKGLYMCGASTHPGGGVTGIPGHNAAKAWLSDN